MDLPSKLTVTPTSVLTHRFDVEERIARATPDDTLKGMFFQRIIDTATEAGVEPSSLSLQAAPMRMRYQAFFDYPVADYFRLVAAVAEKLHPRVAISEGIRRVGGRDFTQFANSKVGRVMLAFTGNAQSTLAKSGAMYGAVLKGSAKIDSEAVAGGVRITYRDYPGLTEVYPIGTIESVCRHYGCDHAIEIDVLSPWDADYLVRID